MEKKRKDISEEEYFKVKNARLREVGQFKKYLNELRYYKKHLGNAFKSYTFGEHLVLTLYALVYVAIFYLVARVAFFAIPDKSLRAIVLFVIFVAFFVGIIVVNKLHQTIVLARVKKDPNTGLEKAVVVVSYMKSQHLFGKTGHSQNVFRTTYRVVLKVDGLRSTTYSSNRYYEKGEEVIVLINKKRYRHCYIPNDVSNA